MRVMAGQGTMAVRPAWLVTAWGRWHAIAQLHKQGNAHHELGVGLCASPAPASAGSNPCQWSIPGCQSPELQAPIRGSPGNMSRVSWSLGAGCAGRELGARKSSKKPEATGSQSGSRGAKFRELKAREAARKAASGVAQVSPSPTIPLPLSPRGLVYMSVVQESGFLLWVVQGAAGPAC